VLTSRDESHYIISSTTYILGRLKNEKVSNKGRKEERKPRHYSEIVLGRFLVYDIVKCGINVAVFWENLLFPSYDS